MSIRICLHEEYKDPVSGRVKERVFELVQLPRQLLECARTYCRREFTTFDSFLCNAISEALLRRGVAHPFGGRQNTPRPRLVRACLAWLDVMRGK